jgi:hypothetical protein
MHAGRKKALREQEGREKSRKEGNKVDTEGPLQKPAFLTRGGASGF